MLSKDNSNIKLYSSLRFIDNLWDSNLIYHFGGSTLRSNFFMNFERFLTLRLDKFDTLVIELRACML